MKPFQPKVPDNSSDQPSLPQEPDSGCTRAGLEAEKKQLWEAQCASEGPFRSAMQTATQAVVITDQTSRILFWNRSAETVFGFSEEEATGQPIRLLVPERLQSRYEEAVGSGVHDQQALTGRTFEVLARRKDGSEFPAEVSVSGWRYGDETFFTGFVRDITRRKEVEQALRESERRFREMLERVRLLAVILNDRGEIVFVNDFLLECTGWTREEVVGRDWFSLFLPEDNRPIVRTVFAMRETQDSFPAHFDNEIITRSGERRLISWNNTLLRDPSGHVEGSSSIGEDVTERRQREGDLNRSHRELERRIQERTQALVDANQALHRSQRDLRALATRLVSVREEENKRMSREVHDQLGQGVTAAKLVLERLAETLSGEQSGQRQSVQMLGSFLDNVLEDVRRIARDLRPAALDHLGLLTAIEWLCQDFESRTDIRFTTRFDFHEPGFDENCSTSVFRIVQEALTNAARHSQAGRVEVSLRAESDRFFALEIVDDGVGIDESADCGRPSLGLIGMRERAMTFGGELSIRRDGERGTRVTLLIPVPV
jgi:PAS domain S-box-containing protein